MEGPVVLLHTKARDHDSPRCSLAPETVELLAKHQRWLREEFSRLDLVLTHQSWVFPRIFKDRTNALEPWRPDYVTARFTELRRQVNLDHVRFHDLRHFVATEMLADGRDIVTVAARLRDNPSTVWTTYAHWRRQADQDAAAAHARKLARLTQPPLGLDET